MTRAVAYYRITLARPSKNELRIEAQRRAVQRFAAKEGYDLIAEHVEVETRKGADVLDRRPELVASLAQARRARCPVIVATLDRLSRDVRFISGLIAYRVPLIVADVGVGANPFMLHDYGLAEKERALISLRTRAALAVKRDAAAKGGNPRRAEALEKARAVQLAAADRFAANILPIIREIQATGCTTPRGIAANLNARGICTPRGTPWHGSRVRSLLLRLAKYEQG